MPREPRVTSRNLTRAVRRLAAADPDLARVVDTHGPPPLWRRAPGFATLVLIVLEQQVSLASARAAYDRLRSAAVPLGPSTFLALSDETLREIGFSRQKAGYCRGLAMAIRDGELDLDGLEDLATGEARGRLLARKGIGPWSADIYLLMALGRRDVWPVGDLALVKAAQALKALPAPPGRDQMAALAEPWRPWRSVAARILWHDYLQTRSPAC